MLDAPFFTEHGDLRGVVVDVLARSLAPLHERDTDSTRTAAADDLWKHLCRIGIPGLGVDEQHGGVGGGMTELAVVVRELGRVLAPRSIVTSTVVARLLSAVEGDAAIDGLLQEVTSGQRLALAVPQPGWAPLGVAWADLDAPGLDRPVASGRLSGVIDVDGATSLVVLPEAGESEDPWRILTADARHPGVGAESTTSAGVMRSFSTLTLDAVPTRSYEIAPEPARLALSEGRLLLAYEMLGAAETVITMAAEHAASREQFGRPIGTFQAVSHRLAAAYIELQAAGASASHALRGHHTPTFELTARVAHSAAAGCLTGGVEAALQVLGAIGYTWEHPLHHYAKYAKTCERTLDTGRSVESEILAYVEGDH